MKTLKTLKKSSKTATPVFYWNTLETPPSNVILTYTNGYKLTPYLITIKPTDDVYKVRVYKLNKQASKPYTPAFDSKPVFKCIATNIFKNEVWISVAIVLQITRKTYVYIGTNIMSFEVNGQVQSLTTIVKQPNGLQKDEHFLTYVTTDNGRYYLMQEQSWVPASEADRYQDPYLYFEECCTKTFTDPDTGKQYVVEGKKHIRHKSFSYQVLNE